MGIEALASEVDDLVHKISQLTAPHGGVVERHVVATNPDDELNIYKELASYDVKELRELVKKTRDRKLIEKLNSVIRIYYDKDWDRDSGILVPKTDIVNFFRLLRIKRDYATQIT